MNKISKQKNTLETGMNVAERERERKLRLNKNNFIIHITESFKSQKLVPKIRILKKGEI